MRVFGREFPDVRDAVTITATRRTRLQQQVFLAGLGVDTELQQRTGHALAESHLKGEREWR
jgi:hypothetical protein